MRRSIDPFNPRELKEQSSLIIKFEQVNLYGDRGLVLENLDFSIQAGDFIFLTGASGVGKSIFLRGLCQKDIKLRGKTYFSPNLKIVQVEQHIKMLPPFTVLENLETVPRIQRSDIEEVAKIFGFDTLLNQKLSTMSYSSIKKVHLARGILCRPDLLILDEPTSGLDKNETQRVYEVLRYTNTKRGMTIVWSTFDRNILKSFSGKNIHLEGRQIGYQGHACYI